jgi:hypothetical protein
MASANWRPANRVRGSTRREVARHVAHPRPRWPGIGHGQLVPRHRCRPIVGASRKRRRVWRPSYPLGMYQNAFRAVTGAIFRAVGTGMAPASKTSLPSFLRANGLSLGADGRPGREPLRVQGQVYLNPHPARFPTGAWSPVAGRRGEKILLPRPEQPIPVPRRRSQRVQPRRECNHANLKGFGGRIKCDEAVDSVDGIG